MRYEISHHGAINGVTGSCHELTYYPNIQGQSACNSQIKRSVLIDCGLLQGSEQSKTGAHADALGIDFSVQSIQALLVTHVHVDHVGRIPYLLAAGFKGPIICSKPSAILLPLVI